MKIVIYMFTGYSKSDIPLMFLFRVNNKNWYIRLHPIYFGKLNLTKKNDAKDVLGITNFFSFIWHVCAS